MIVTSTKGIESFSDYIRDLPEVATKAATMTLNRAADKARTAGARMIADQIEFPGGYLSPKQGRLSVTRQASRNDMTAVVTGRNRPTTLARFVRNRAAASRKKNRQQVKVNVKRGGARKELKRSFLTRGRSGNELLVMRTDGGPPPGTYKPARFGQSGKLWVVYGPSVGQAFKSVSRDIIPEIEDFVGKEFQRNFNRLAK